MDLGKNIAKARKNANLTQEQLAEKLQVARQTVSKWEAGTTMPTVPGLVKLAKALETDCNSLLAEEENGLCGGLDETLSHIGDLSAGNGLRPLRNPVCRHDTESPEDIRLFR